MGPLWSCQDDDAVETVRRVLVQALLVVALALVPFDAEAEDHTDEEEDTAEGPDVTMPETTEGSVSAVGVGECGHGDDDDSAREIADARPTSPPA